MKNLIILLSFALTLFLFSSCSETDLGTQVGNAYCDCTEKYKDLAERNECLVKITDDYKVKQEALTEEERKTVQKKVEEVSAACMGIE